ncbi:hypothetical protein RZS08_47145, partial [Arthrospira platensis SPKY1]|nr:hypothetical protein [Arthrospira platensis SPKY1]
MLVSVRTGIASNTVVCTKAAWVQADGTIEFIPGHGSCDLDITENYYLVVEHRNHLLVMSHQPIPVSGNQLVYDFRNQDSYTGLLGFGQKELAQGVFGMFAGNGDQTNSSSS